MRSSFRQLQLMPEPGFWASRKLTEGSVSSLAVNRPDCNESDYRNIRAYCVSVGPSGADSGFDGIVKP